MASLAPVVINMPAAVVSLASFVTDRIAATRRPPAVGGRKRQSEFGEPKAGSRAACGLGSGCSSEPFNRSRPYR